MPTAYLTHYFPPETNAPAARVPELSKALVAAGHTVHVVTGQPNHPRGQIYPGYHAAEFRRDNVDGIDVRRVPTLASASRGVLVRGLGYAALPPIQILAGLALPPGDVVLATSPQILTGLAGLVLARLRRVPFVLEVRDLWPEGITATGALREGHPVIRALELVERALYWGAAGIVSVTDSFVDHFLPRGVPPERIAVIKNGIDADLFDAHTPPARADGFQLDIDMGVRDLDQARRLLRRGAARVILSLESFPDPRKLPHWVTQLGPEKLLFSLDLKNGYPLIAESSAATGDAWPSDPLAIVDRVASSGITQFIVLDLAHVGSNTGIGTLDLCRAIAAVHPHLSLISGGGIRSISDLESLQSEPLAGILIASSLHDGRISSAELRTMTEL